MPYKSTILRAKQIAEIVDKYYEEGRQDRCKLWVYRHYIRPQFAISERTFFYYLAIASATATAASAVQLTLF